MAKPKNRTKAPAETNRGDASVPPTQPHQHTRQRSLLRSPAAKRARSAAAPEPEADEPSSPPTPRNRAWPEDRRTATNPPLSLSQSFEPPAEAPEPEPPAATPVPTPAAAPPRAGAGTGIALVGSVGLTVIGGLGALVLLAIGLASWWLG
ncbi:MAG: hypothetical protein H6737_06480 [Alphaproteobacteria bacterium]|nr:hypothetical protein [Alphaproteobacteria bacterium]